MEVDTFFRLSLPAVVEQVIDVPKLALPGRAVQRAALSEPQLVEQLVEVPTVLSFSLLQQRTAEQTIDIAVPRRGGGARGGLQGFSQGQDSTAVCGADNVVSPVPHARGGLHGFPRGQSSTASAVEQTIAVDRLQGFTRGQSSTSRRGDALPLPSGWRRAEDAYGSVYFWHVHTRQTQFTPPASDDEDEDEEDEDTDEIYAESRFPAGFRPMRMRRWFTSGNCRQGWGCMFAHSVSELHPLAHGQGP